MSLLLRALAALCLSSLLAAGARAAPTAEQREAEFKAVMEEVGKVRIVGPAEIKLRDQAMLKLPAGIGFIPQPAAGRFMQALGNTTGDQLMGLFDPNEGDWLVVAKYEAAGYIKDDDAKDWNVDDLYKSLKEGTDQANENRRERGIPELEVLGWIEKPHYDAATRRLVWAIAVRRKGSDEAQQSVNYNTYALGREGFISLNLIAAQQRIEQEKPFAHTLLAALEFNEGKRYADFDSRTDRVAEYGLAALVAGVAAKKLGLIAVVLAFLAKFAKVIGIAVIAVGAVAARFFKRRKSGDTAP